MIVRFVIRFHSVFSFVVALLSCLISLFVLAIV